MGDIAFNFIKKKCLPSPGSETSSVKSSGADKKRSRRSQQQQDLTNVPPPGYVQSLISKIISNVKIVCNNLILKYVEDDIVLSLNTRWLCLSPANALWEAAFVESLSLYDLVLRKKLEVKDMTVCLDKRDASGRIEIYQEPFCKCPLPIQHFFNELFQIKYLIKFTNICKDTYSFYFSYLLCSVSMLNDRTCLVGL